MNALMLPLMTILWLAVAPPPTSPPPIMTSDLAVLEQAAFRAAVSRVAPSVVQIETGGGLERVDKLLLGSGPTTGLVVDPQGYIVSSAFNFVGRPTLILVRLADGKRRPARLVATDHSRMLVLLKIDVDHPLPVPEIAPQAEMRIGQWTIAVGRAFDVAQPNIAVGILSAVGRIWQKALQTSAAVSPNSYGGPLVNIQGRVMGVLVPLAPDSDSELAGVNWYDSGIGFAIPAEHLMKVLPRLKKGEDLRGGLMGIGFRGRNLQSEPPVLARCRPRSPADKAGLREGDRIVAIDGRSVDRAAQVREAISRRYAGDELRVAVLRDGKPLTFGVQLVDKLVPFEQPILGILPRRNPALAAETGVTVRWVYAEGPAAKAGLRAGDRLVALDGKPITDRDSLVDRLGNYEPEAEVRLEFVRGTQQQSVKLRLGRLSEDPPPKELPPARTGQGPSAKRAVSGTGTVAIKAGHLPNEVWACVPEDYQPAAAHGLLVWLQGDNAVGPKELIGRWAPCCRRQELILVVPKPAHAGTWRATDAELVAKLVQQMQSSYTIDAARIVAGGQDLGGAVALQAARQHPAVFRGVIAVDAPLVSQPAESEPGQVQSFLLITAGNRLLSRAVARVADLLRSTKVPVTVKDLGQNDVFASDFIGEMVRWIDMLDRI